MPDHIEALEPALKDATPIDRLFFNELKLISKKIDDNRNCVIKKIDDLRQDSAAQTAICNDKFVKRVHVYVACICAVCFGIGAGLLTFTEVMAWIK